MGLPPHMNLKTGCTAKLPGDWKQQATVKPRQKYTPHEMNKTEAAYARELDALELAGLIDGYAFESVKLWLLGERTWFTPDFAVATAIRTVEFHEVKGTTKDGKPYYREGAKDKLKIAAGIYRSMARFFVVWHVKGEGWKREEF